MGPSPMTSNDAASQKPPNGPPDQRQWSTAYPRFPNPFPPPNPVNPPFHPQFPGNYPPYGHGMPPPGVIPPGYYPYQPFALPMAPPGYFAPPGPIHHPYAPPYYPQPPFHPYAQPFHAPGPFEPLPFPGNAAPFAPHAPRPLNANGAQGATEKQFGRSKQDFVRNSGPDPAADEDPDYYWPSGEVLRVYKREDDCPPDHEQAIWQWRQHGVSNFGLDKGGTTKAKTSGCLGVNMCFACDPPRPTRPKTQPDTNEKYIRKGCTICGTAPLTGIDCDAKCHRYPALNDAGEYEYRWEHEGFHNHERPPAGKLTPSQARQLQFQVIRAGPKASAIALRTGDIHPGSVPLPEISSVLTNPPTARYYVKKAQESLGMPKTTAPPTRGGVSLLKEIMGIDATVGEKFLVDSILGPQGVFIFQTAFMKTVLEATVDAWVTSDPIVDGRHGFVTDGSHSYLREGVLLTTCAFSKRLRAWVPVLYSIILGEDEEHHCRHFEFLFDIVIVKVKRDGLRFKKEFLFNVMDFSLSQRGGHATAYSRAAPKLIQGFNELSADAQAVQISRLREEAKDFEGGCHFHFFSQATRVKTNTGLVPHEQIPAFDRILYTMVAAKTTSESFDLLVDEFRQQFPEAWGWLVWWLQPSVIGMIFPAKSTVDPDVTKKVPKTSNAVEASHSLLNDAVGSGNEFIEGVKKMHLHVKRFQSEDKAITSGHYTPSGPREHRAPKRVHFFENDGRAPDTAAALRGLDPSSRIGHDTLSRRPLFTQGYSWKSPNSCFYDHGLELWFRAYCLWSEDSRARLRNGLSTSSFLHQLVTHFDRRLKFITQNARKDAKADSLLASSLDEMQGTIRKAIFESWYPKLKKNENQSASQWLHCSVTDGHPDRPGTQDNPLGFFSIYQGMVYRCEDGHELHATPRPGNVLTTISPQYLEVLLNGLGVAASETIGLGDYFSNIFSVDPGSDTFTELCDAEDDFGVGFCSGVDCDNAPKSSAVSFSWPQILTVESNLRMTGRKTAQTASRLRYDTTFTIVDSRADAKPVEYALVGRILHKKNHFSAELMLGGVGYTYDDLTNHAKLRKANSGIAQFEKRTISEVYYVYHRTSPGHEASAFLMDTGTHRNIDDAQRNYHWYTSVDTKGDSKSNPLEEVEDSDNSEDIPLSVQLRKETGEPAPKVEPKAVVSKVVPAPVVRDKGRPSDQTKQVSIVDLEIPPCPSCGLRGALANATIDCDLCLLTWHRLCIAPFISKDAALGIRDIRFCCPHCRYAVNGRWDRLMLGSFILVSISQATKIDNQHRDEFYPAQVISRHGDRAELEWHKFINWPQKSPMLNTRFTMTPQECYDARYYEISHHYNAILGSILWPLVLSPCSTESDLKALRETDEYGLEQALTDSFGSVLDIVLGLRFHPIQNLMKEWMAKITPRIQGRARRDHIIQFSKTLFYLPLYPAHQSLVESFFSDASKEHEAIQDNEEATVCGQVLLQLVVLRQYMKLTPSHDTEIYLLARVLDDNEYQHAGEADMASLGRFRRTLSIHEKALACYQTSILDTSSLEAIASNFDDGFDRINTVMRALSRTMVSYRSRNKILWAVDSGVPVEDPGSLVSAVTQSGRPFAFGSPIPPEYAAWKDDMTLTGPRVIPVALGKTFPNVDGPIKNSKAPKTFRIVTPASQSTHEASTFPPRRTLRRSTMEKRGAETRDGDVAKRKRCDMEEEGDE